jgi:DNA-binding NarL/FixJ family response regulator
MNKLTKKDWEIIKWKAHGYTAEQIAPHLYIAPKTVKNRLTGIYKKLDVKNAIQMLRKLNEQGIDVWSL